MFLDDLFYIPQKNTKNKKIYFSAKGEETHTESKERSMLFLSIPSVESEQSTSELKENQKLVIVEKPRKRRSSRLKYRFL